ncbi:MAG: hypothetical protein J7K46_11050 [Bacteroidales bacterium]|nr:hypothetical protein [Bacteroidales bacterium]
MTKNFQRTVLLFWVFAGIFSGVYSSMACTSVIVSGKYTRTGRPLMWKNRDTKYINNKVVYFKNGPYSCIGVVNSVDTLNKNIWMGINSVGFAIMNTASYNLDVKDTLKHWGIEGVIMKAALQHCASLADFEELLDTLSRPTHMTTNFGVIDAEGGAAYYEVGFRKYTKLDVNDPVIAPLGYVVHTNFSFTGVKGTGAGYIRYNTADALFRKAMENGTMSARFLMQEGSRCLRHSLTGVDLSLPDEEDPAVQKMVWFEDFIPRKSSASAMAVVGVKPGEDPLHTTMWTILGFPITSVAIPLWITPHGKLPSLVTYDKTLKDAPLCHFALALKKKCYPVTWGSSANKYINIHAVINKDHTGIKQRIRPLEDEIFDTTEEKLENWRKNGFKEKTIEAYYQWLDNKIYSFFAETYHLERQPSFIHK